MKDTFPFSSRMISSNKPTTRNKRGKNRGEETTTNKVEHWTEVGEEQGALRVIFDRVKIRRGVGRDELRFIGSINCTRIYRPSIRFSLHSFCNARDNMHREDARRSWWHSSRFIVVNVFANFSRTEGKISSFVDSLVSLVSVSLICNA